MQSLYNRFGLDFLGGPLLKKCLLKLCVFGNQTKPDFACCSLNVEFCKSVLMSSSNLILFKELRCKLKEEKPKFWVCAKRGELFEVVIKEPFPDVLIIRECKSLEPFQDQLIKLACFQFVLFEHMLLSFGFVHHQLFIPFGKLNFEFF